MQRAGGAHLFGQLEAGSIQIGNEHAGTTRGSQRLQGKQPDHPGPDHQSLVLGGDPGERNGVHRNRQGLEHRRLSKRQTGGQMVGHTGGDGHILGKSSMAAIVSTGNAQHLAAIAKVYFSPQTVAADAAGNRRIKGDAVAGGDAGYARAHRGHDPRGLVSHHNGRNAAPRGTVIAMHVAAANAAGRDPNQNLVRLRESVDRDLQFPDDDILRAAAPSSWWWIRPFENGC